MDSVAGIDGTAGTPAAVAGNRLHKDVVVVVAAAAAGEPVVD